MQKAVNVFILQEMSLQGERNAIQWKINKVLQFQNLIALMNKMYQ